MQQPNPDDVKQLLLDIEKTWSWVTIPATFTMRSEWIEPVAEGLRAKFPGIELELSEVSKRKSTLRIFSPYPGNLKFADWAASYGGKQ